ncbi:chromo-helicase DNA-binding protein, putative [Babesia bigemina]|uniref:Chromo-helicase DNA-binding protein, putative n=1 Tax=Babesia bigemina TaxID=5866 RepID=A0A061D609_BABBI|nr:chromo-helicase DNA-binding protein, putative [Babesia bigemina]CDR94349.1 chromo-helicase DNA-binding protein, putative [Babesia bigemina]|eukprot:XP_012766535.1 chromo-helicase DNA-binding protein, putative [Babesia bigemina]
MENTQKTLAADGQAQAHEPVVKTEIKQESATGFKPPDVGQSQQQPFQVADPKQAYYQQQMMYSRMMGQMHQQNMISQQMTPGGPQHVVQQQQQPQMQQGQVPQGHGVAYPGMMRPQTGMQQQHTQQGAGWFYPMAMYNQQMMSGGQVVHPQMMMNNQAAVMSKFMPQYNAYMNRVQQSAEIKTERPAVPTEVKKEESVEKVQNSVSENAAQSIKTEDTNGEKPKYHAEQAQAAGANYTARYGMQPQYGYGMNMPVNPMMYYQQQNRLVVGNAIEGIPALRMANSRFQNVTQMLDALAQQPKKKQQRKSQPRYGSEDTDFKSVVNDYFTTDGRNDNSDDEFLVGRSVKDVDTTAIRRSGRARTKNSLYAEYTESDADTWEEPSVRHTQVVPKMPRKRRETGMQSRRTQQRSTANPYSKNNYVTYDDTDEESEEYANVGAADSGPLALRHRKRRVNYAEMEHEQWSGEDGEDAEDEEDAEERERRQNTQQELQGGIDRVIDHRVNEEGVTEYLIKWQGYAHIHNTWDVYEALKDYGGIKRLDNYIKKLKQRESRSLYMTPDEIEHENIDMELQRRIDEDALKAERIVTHYVDKENSVTYYMVKWRSCTYDQCTYEEEQVMIDHEFNHLIQEYKEREDRISGESAKKMPWNTHSLSLTKFEPYQETPTFLANYETRKLRDYQLIGVNWIVNRMKRGLSVLLADEMGLGKTVQTITLIGHFLYREGLIGPYLVIVPQSTIDNWMREFETWLPKANVVCYYGNAKAREIIRTYELAKVHVPGKGERYRCDVCVTTPSIINAPLDLEFLRRISWQLMVVDEAHQLKNRNSKRFVELRQFMADYKLLLSGTPLHNNLEELWTLLHFINPQIYPYYEEFRRRYADVENAAAIGENKQKQLLALQQELHEVVLRRVKKDVEKSLPNKVERILRVELSPLQVEWYRNILTRNYDQLAKNSGGSRSSLQNICMELKKVCNHPFLCYEPEDRQTWSQGLVYGSGKICLLEKLLMRLKERGHRVLIFSQMVRMLNIISEYLTLRGFKHQRLDGTMGREVRKKAMDHFNDPNSDDFCFLLSTKAGGLGINLTTADTVIIYDSDWNPQNDLQAEARAHRIGQTKTVQIYRLVTKDSIEQTILERAKTKMVLDALVVQGLNKKSNAVVLEEGGSKCGFSREELAKILKFGASKLWSKDKNNTLENASGEENLEIDLDKVLEEAEVTNDNDGLASDLLSTYTNITEFRYEPPEEQSEISSENNKEFWDATIPLEERVKLKKKKEEELMVLGPRRTRNKDLGGMDNDDFSDDEADVDFQPKRDSKMNWDNTDSQGEKGVAKRRGPKRSRKVVLTIKDKVKIYRSLSKFGVPEMRLKDIHEDTKLTKVDPRVILNECQNLIDMCKTKISEMGNDDAMELSATSSAAMKRASKAVKAFELGDAKISPLEFIKKLKLLECLEDWGRQQAGPGWATSDQPLELPTEVLEQFADVKEPWAMEDCVNLLKLIHIHGYGYWTLYCNDKNLCVGALSGMKHDKAKFKAQKLLKALYEHRSHLVKSKLPDVPMNTGLPPVPYRKNSKLEELVVDDDAVVGKDDGKENAVELMLTTGKPLMREHFAAAVKWSLRDGRDRLKRLKFLKDQNAQGEEFLKEVEEALPELKSLIESAVGQCKDPTTGQKLKAACLRFVSKFTLLPIEELEKEVQ